MFNISPLHLFFGVIFLSFKPAFSQQLQYEIIWKGDSVGYLIADKSKTNMDVHYKIESSVVVKFFASIKLDYYFSNQFNNGMLKKAHTRNLMNENLRASSQIKWDGKQYDMMVDDEQTVLKEKIDYTMTTLYYDEPKNVDKVFSERYATFCTIKPVGKGKYELTLPNGKKNYYNYVNGKCTEVEVNHSLATFYFKLMM